MLTVLYQKDDYYESKEFYGNFKSANDLIKAISDEFNIIEDPPYFELCKNHLDKCIMKSKQNVFYKPGIALSYEYYNFFIYKE